MASNSVNPNSVSAVVGYTLNKGNFQTTSPNLPQRIAVLAEANDTNQTGLAVDTNGNPTPVTITSAQQAGTTFGYGSPIHLISRILLPIQGGGVSGIPVLVYAQKKAVGAKPTILQVAPAGTATANVTHTLIISGRNNVDGIFYNLNIETGDNAATISTKITDAVNAVLGSPCTANDTGYNSQLTTKWSGLTSADFNVTVDVGSNAAGIAYTVSSVQTGAGLPSTTNSLGLFGNDWNTIVVNSYGLQTQTMTELEAFNGIADPTNPTGRYVGITFKPFIALSGSIAEDPSSTTDARLNDMTIAVCPAPLSTGFQFEAAANMCVLHANNEQNSPQTDILNQSYPDMPTPKTIGAMAVYTNRDSIVQKGCSTVDLSGGLYIVKDFVTTYHPVGELPPQYRYCRNLQLDWNVRFTYYLLEQINVVGKAISDDNTQVTAQNVIKPKMWKAIVSDMFKDLAKRGLIVSPDFSDASLSVNISTTNPDRFETTFSYKRSGVARIASTTATAGFNFGNL